MVHESSAWAARRAPRITAIIALRGPCEQIAATLDSLARSRLRDFEIVLVNGGEGDGPRETARDWISEHPRIPARLVVGDRSGLGMARNIGLDLARGAFSLILDSGQELYPRCLEALAQALEATPEMAFVYPIQEVTGAPEDFVNTGGDYLLSLFGWDRGRLHRESDIRAPALIRTDRLRRLGGFPTDPHMAGFQGRDIWCRLADPGWPGQLVPQVLARRPEWGASPTLSVPQP